MSGTAWLIAAITWWWRRANYMYTCKQLQVATAKLVTDSRPSWVLARTIQSVRWVYALVSRTDRVSLSLSVATQIQEDWASAEEETPLLNSASLGRSLAKQKRRWRACYCLLGIALLMLLALAIVAVAATLLAEGLMSPPSCATNCTWAACICLDIWKLLMHICRSCGFPGF